MSMNKDIIVAESAELLVGRLGQRSSVDEARGRVANLWTKLLQPPAAWAEEQSAAAGDGVHLRGEDLPCAGDEWRIARIREAAVSGAALRVEQPPTPPPPPLVVADGEPRTPGGPAAPQGPGRAGPTAARADGHFPAAVPMVMVDPPRSPLSTPKHPTKPGAAATPAPSGAATLRPEAVPAKPPADEPEPVSEFESRLLADLDLGALSKREDFGRRVAAAMAAVTDEMLQLKYRSGIDGSDFVTKLEAQCDPYVLISALRAAREMNTKPDFWVRERIGGASGPSGRLLHLRFACRELRTFEEVRQVVRLLPGTASVVATVTAAGGHAVDVVAAFRPCYAEAGTVVGRCWSGSRWPMRHFGEADFCGAVFLDPDIATVSGTHGDGYSFPLRVAPEYEALSALLRRSASGKGGGPADGYPTRERPIVPHVPEGFYATIHAQAPTPAVLQRIRSILERPDVEPEALVELLRKVANWIKQDDTSAATTRQAIADADAHKAILFAMRRCGAKTEVGTWAFRVIGWASRHHAGNAISFTEAGAVLEVCRLLELHDAHRDLQRHGLYLLGVLAHYGGGGPRAVACGAVKIALRAIARHRDTAAIQINGCEMLRCLAELGEAPMDELGRVAQDAKRAFPRDAAVHRAADALLVLVVPRTAAAIGSLMDARIGDAEVQSSGIHSLGQLALYGGIAWRSSGSGAVCRVLRAMSTHKGNVHLQATGLWALGRLAERVEAPTAGMLDAAKRAKQSHQDSALVCQYATHLEAYLMR